MTDGDALLFGALDCPEDRTARLVLADWLDERGHGEQAEVVRARCALAARSPNDPTRPGLLAQELALCEKNRGAWVEQCGLPLTWPQAVTLFRWRLAETMAWCRDSESLRAPTLRPVWMGGHFEPLYEQDLSERQAFVNGLAVARARLLAQQGRLPARPPEDVGTGRLLVFYPDATLSDGASEVASDGFFDAYNYPAWGTWVLATEDSRHEPLSYCSYLVIWVPPEWVARVDVGVRVNPEECIRWASDVDTELTRRLRAAGLL